MKTLPNRETIIRCYRYANVSCFSDLTEEQMQLLDAAVEKWRYYFTNSSIGILSMMTFTAEKMLSSNGRYTAVTPLEKMYFYVRMIDPEFLFLEAHESGNTIEEIKQLCIQNFRVYDPTLIRHEKEILKVMKNAPDNLWDLERIKR